MVLLHSSALLIFFRRDVAVIVKFSYPFYFTFSTHCAGRNVIVRPGRCWSYRSIQRFVAVDFFLGLIVVVGMYSVSLYLFFCTWMLASSLSLWDDARNIVLLDSPSLCILFSVRDSCSRHVFRAATFPFFFFSALGRTHRQYLSWAMLPASFYWTLRRCRFFSLHMIVAIGMCFPCR